jgi:hypothetical protein
MTLEQLTADAFCPFEPEDARALNELQQQQHYCTTEVNPTQERNETT